MDEREVHIGSHVEGTLRAAIHERVDFVVLFIGPEAVRSKWVKRELAWALTRERVLDRYFILPILLDEASWSRVPAEIKTKRYLLCTDFSEAGVRMFAQRLSDELFALISEPPEYSPGLRSLLHEQEIEGRLDRASRIAKGILDDQDNASGESVLTRDRLELLVTVLEPFRRLELLCIYELQRGRFRHVAQRESIETMEKVLVECGVGERGTWSVSIDLSTEALRPLREDYGLGDRNYIVRDVFLDALERLSDGERRHFFSGLELRTCTFLR